jgi:hypothetical protein
MADLLGSRMLERDTADRRSRRDSSERIEMVPVDHDLHDDPSHDGRAARRMGVTIDDARAIAARLPRSYEAIVRDGLRFRVGRIVYAAFYEDDTIMGFGFPKEEREGLVASEPDKFLMPRPSEMRYRWVCVRLDAIEVEELGELLVDAWRMCVPKKVSDAYDG